MRQAFKNTLQPLEKALKKAFGIRKERKGQIFDSRGIANDSREKITRYILFIPLFQRIRTPVGISEFRTVFPPQIFLRGISQKICKPKSTLYTIKTHYKIFGVLIFFKTTTLLNNPRNLSLYATIGNNDFANIGEYVATNPNIENDIFISHILKPKSSVKLASKMFDFLEIDTKFDTKTMPNIKRLRKKRV